MAAPALRPETPEERIVHNTIVWTWLFWVLGALYFVAPVIGWYLAVLGLRRWLGTARGGFDYPTRIPAGVIVWWLGMAGMLFALIAGHIDFDLGFGQMLKSAIGWAKGWALIALFPWIGAMLRIRPAIIYRATNQLALQSILFTPIFVAAALARLPHPFYISPLLVLGGPGPEYFSVEFYSIDNTNGNLRWRYFAPWAPAAAFVANISFVFALYDQDRFWKACGIICCILVCLLTQSRLGLLAIPVILLIGLLLHNLTRVLTIGTLSGLITLAAFLSAQIAGLIADMTEKFNGARAASTRVRALLGSIAKHRWASEAPIFGHGIVEKGPHLVEHMFIGSHHSWYGLLFVKGIVGFLSLAIPLAWTFCEMVAKAQCDRVARCALGVTVIITLYTFGENLEILSYMIWPGLIVIGTACRRRFFNPLRGRLGS